MNKLTRTILCCVILILLCLLLCECGSEGYLIKSKGGSLGFAYTRDKDLLIDIVSRREVVNLEIRSKAPFHYEEIGGGLIMATKTKLWGEDWWYLKKVVRNKFLIVADGSRSSREYWYADFNANEEFQIRIEQRR